MCIRKLIGRLFTKPKYLTSLPAPTEGDYPLRMEQEERLYRALQQRGRHILLYGPGGIGKTHMARKLFYRLRRDYKCMAWVEYGTNIRTSLTPPPIDGVEEGIDVRFERFVRSLEEASEDTILFIDDAKEDAMDDTVLAQITGMGVTILMTSRCKHISPYETWELEPVSAQECAALFYANYAQDPKRTQMRAVLTLADRLERNVFAMLLLARVAGKPENLPRIMECMTPGTLLDHIGQFLDQSQLTEAERRILHCLSLMPSGEILENLVNRFDFQSDDVEELVRKGWLTRNSEAKSIILHDLVREYYMAQELDEDTAETFVKAALGENLMAGVEPQAAADFKGKVLAFQVKALGILERIRTQNDNDLAKAYTNVGIEYSEFGDYRRALEYQRKALDICEKTLPSNHPDLARSYNNVGNAYGALGNYQRALENQLKALAICEKALPSNHPDLAASYNNVGNAYGALGDHQKALENQLKALAIREKALPSNHPDLAGSYNNVGAAYGDLGDHQRALENKLKALAIFEKTLPSNHPDLAASYNNVGAAYGALGDHQRALEYKLKALAIREKTLPSNHPDLASSYNNVGAAYGALGDHQRALENQLKALAIREKVLPSNHPDLAVSYYNVGVSYIKMGELGAALEWMRRALTVAERSLPENHPTRVSIRKAVQEMEKQIKQQRK